MSLTPCIHLPNIFFVLTLCVGTVAGIESVPQDSSSPCPEGTITLAEETAFRQVIAALKGEPASCCQLAF